MNEFVQIINSVGFPIAACVALYIQMNKQNEQLSEIMEKHTKEQRELVNKFNEAINNNTRAIVELTTIVKGGVK